MENQKEGVGSVITETETKSAGKVYLLRDTKIEDTILRTSYEVKEGKIVSISLAQGEGKSISIPANLQWAIELHNITGAILNTLTIES